MPVPCFPAASEAQHEQGFLHAKDNLRLYWQRYTPPSPRATVAILPGGGDHGGRYAGLTAALVRSGLQAALLDFRGHGQSDGRRWHIDAFRDYLDDTDVFMDHVRAGAAGRTIFVVGHSQGALIAATWGLVPGRGVAGFVLSSPYLRLKLEPPRLKILGARLVGTVVPWLPISTDLRYDDLTSDQEMQRWTGADPLYGKATTPRWFVESRRAQGQTLRAASTFAYPVLVMVGTGDAIADPEAGRTFFQQASSRDKQLQEYPGFRHEIFNERERDRPIGDAVAWILARSS
jgi:alpha-beta hydrolase superfamily lysophospholipase